MVQGKEDNSQESRQSKGEGCGWAAEGGPDERSRRCSTSYLRAFCGSQLSRDRARHALSLLATIALCVELHSVQELCES